MKLKLRPYQKEACQAAYSSFFKEGLDSGVICLPTGGGKTFTASFLCALIHKHQNLKILWFAHREELIKQAAEAWRRVAPGLKITTWCANKIRVDDEILSDAKDATGDIVLCMIKSSRQLPKHLQNLHDRTGRKWMLVVDEAHHYAKPKDPHDKYRSEYLTILHEQIAKKGLVVKTLGLTATPERLDERPLNFDKIIYAVRFVDLVRMGHLARPIYYEMRTTENIGKLDIRGGDYTAAALRRLNTPRRNLAIAREYVSKKDKYGKTLVFACDVQHTQDLRDAFRKLDPDLPIEVITGSYSKQDRARVRKWLDEDRHTEPKVLINCMVYTEGFDCQSLNSIFMARPTVSKSLWMQMVGRGARVVTRKVQIPRARVASAPDPGTRGVVELVDGRKKEFFVHEVADEFITVDHLEKQNFNLVNITDNITNYATLVHEWSMDIRVDEEASSYQKEKRAKTARKKRRKKAQEVLDKYAREQASGLDEARLVDVQGVLIFSTLFHDRIGIPMDQDRLDCIAKLKEYIKSCWINEPSPFGDGEDEMIFDQATYQQSYSFCVPANEFPLPLWTKLTWAYYWRFIAGKKELRLKKKDPTNPHEPVKVAKTWHYTSFVDLRDPKVIEETRKRIRRDMEVARRINAEFNAKFAKKSEVEKLFAACYSKAMANKSIKPATKNALKFVLRNTCGLAAKDRRLTVTTSMQIRGDTDPVMGKMYRFRIALSEAMQALLNDSSCQVVCLTRESKLIPDNEFAFNLSQKQFNNLKSNAMGDETFGS